MLTSVYNSIKLERLCRSAVQFWLHLQSSSSSTVQFESYWLALRGKRWDNKQRKPAFLSPRRIMPSFEPDVPSRSPSHSTRNPVIAAAYTERFVPQSKCGKACLDFLLFVASFAILWRQERRFDRESSRYQHGDSICKALREIKPAP